ncbi:MAG: hypothetical protein HQM16_02630 [Deltaproteobacteria bacterium]|nr:hypothetical protein [Deltaproteobacteria bacterium]
MFARKLTPYLGLLFGALILLGVWHFFEYPERPFTFFQLILLYMVSVLPGMGLAMFLDPAPQALRKEFLKENFYEHPEAADKYLKKWEESCK